MSSCAWSLFAEVAMVLLGVGVLGLCLTFFACLMIAAGRDSRDEERGNRR